MSYNEKCVCGHHLDDHVEVEYQEGTFLECVVTYYYKRNGQALWSPCGCREYGDQ
jgi:hypothetical protein